MDEIVVRIARTIACLPRLQILSCLARTDERPPSELARELRMKRGVLSTHLSKLAVAGLVQRRRAGVWCYYAGKSPYSQQAFSGKLCAWLLTTLGNPEQTMRRCGHHQRRGTSASSLEANLHALVFEAVTAFTNVRRLQILRHLVRHGDATVATFMRELKMSKFAVARHTDKLLRRGYLRCAREGRGLKYGLVKELKTPVHAAIFQMVQAEWARVEK